MRKSVRDLEAEIAALAKENEALTQELVAMRAERAPAAPPAKPKMAESQGTRVLYPPPESTLVMPDDIELHRLMAIPLAVYQNLGPKFELSFEQRRTVRNHPQLADETVPDVAAINASFFREFKLSFIAIGSMRRTDQPDRAHYVGFHSAAAQSWLRSHNLFADISNGAFILAALAHGDVPYTSDELAGQLWELGLSAYVGGVARAAWKQVLAHGKLRQESPVPPHRRLAAASPVRVY
jgi:hypothetical protein